MTQIARVRTSISGLLGGTGLGTAYFAGPGDVDANIALEAAKRVRAFWSSLAAHTATSITYQVQAQVDVLTAETGQLANSFGVTAQAAVPGTEASGLLPAQDQGLLQLHTGAVINGKRVTGRINHAGVTQGEITGGGVPTATYITALGTAGALLNTLILTACSNVVWHRPKAGAGGAGVLVTSYTGAAKFATLNSRRD